MTNFKPKPTGYRGVEFRSRLEARWAIFFDNCRGVRSWAYEPIKLRLTEQDASGHPVISEYIPDFSVEVERNRSRVTLYFEIKPTYPSLNYLRFLKSFLVSWDKPFYLVAGNFYKTVPKFIELTSGQVKQPSSMASHPDFVAKDVYSAISKVRSYRFDLEQS